MRDNNIAKTPIGGQFYKIFVNLNKNNLPELINFIETNPKSQWNDYFQEKFKSDFISFQSSLC